jgi:hypothetical protein
MTIETTSAMKTDQLINLMYEALQDGSCKTYSDLTSKINEKLDGSGVYLNIGRVATAMAHLRKNCGQYGWTIPHIKRGVPNVGEEERIFYTLVDKGGNFWVSEGDRENLNRGMNSTVQQVVTEVINSAKALDGISLHVRSRLYAERMKDWADDLRYIARKGKALLRLVQADGTNGG